MFTKHLTILLALGFIFWACNDNTSQKVKAIKLVEHPLGKSKMRISIPDNYVISESQGPDFIVYYFSPADTSDKISGSAGVYFGGHPHLFGPDTISCINSTKTSRLLNKTAVWSIYDCSNHFSAETVITLGDHEKVHAFCISKVKGDIDSLIKSFESLKE